jgi:outer membrane protein assembly factor BamB
VADLDKDGTDDLVYVTYDRKIIALNGGTGKKEWIRDLPQRIYDYTISNVGDKKNPVFVVNETTWDSTNVYRHNMLFINAKGHVIRKKSLSQDNCQYGLNSLHTPDGMTVSCLQHSILLTSVSGKFNKINRKRNFSSTNYNGDSVVESRNSDGALLAQTIFSYKGNNQCIMVLNQRDGAYYEKGFVEIVSLDSRKVLGSWQLPAASELAPVVGDINMDGTLDVLINAYDGYLYCYSLGIPASNIQYTNKNN